jgi:hypothetical protein
VIRSISYVTAFGSILFSHCLFSGNTVTQFHGQPGTCNYAVQYCEFVEIDIPSISYTASTTDAVTGNVGNVLSNLTLTGVVDSLCYRLSVVEEAGESVGAVSNVPEVSVSGSEPAHGSGVISVSGEVGSGGLPDSGVSASGSQPGDESARANVSGEVGSGGITGPEVSASGQQPGDESTGAGITEELPGDNVTGSEVAVLPSEGDSGATALESNGTSLESATSDISNVTSETSGGTGGSVDETPSGGLGTAATAGIVVGILVLIAIVVIIIIIVVTKKGSQAVDDGEGEVAEEEKVSKPEDQEASVPGEDQESKAEDVPGENEPAKSEEAPKGPEGEEKLDEEATKPGVAVAEAPPDAKETVAEAPANEVDEPKKDVKEVDEPKRRKKRKKTD